MERTYKCLKAAPGTAWEVGKTFALDEDYAKFFVEKGYIEATATEIEIAVDRLEKRFQANQAQTVAVVVDEVFKRLQASNANGKAFGPNIGKVEDEADKTKSFPDQLRCIVMAQCNQLVNHPDYAYLGGFEGQKAARERLAKVYGSTLNPWSTKAALAESSGTTGGYTVAPNYGTELLKIAAEESLIRPLADVKNLPAREAFYPMLNQTAGQPTQGTNYAGGAYMNWTSEAATVPETAEPNFKQVHMVTNELTGLAKISLTLMSDTFLAMDAELRSIFGIAIAYEEDFQFLNGNGTGKPLGINKAAALQTVQRTTPNQFVLNDAAQMMAKLLPRSRPKACWLMESLIFSQLVQLVDASGRVTYVPNVGTGYGEAKLAETNLVLFGRPVLFTEKLNALGTQGDILLIDGSYYLVADTGGLEIAVSDQYAFNTAQLTFRVRKRVDGKPRLDAPFTQQNGNTVTPFVALTA